MNNGQYNNNGQYYYRQYNNEQYNNEQNNNNNMNSVGDMVTTAATWYGYTQGIYYVIFGSIIICILFCVSYYIYTNALKYNSPIIDAKVLYSNCRLNSDGKGKITYSCNLDLSYIVNNTTYNNKLYVTSNRVYNSNDTIKIKYNVKSSNPNDIIEYNIFNNTTFSLTLACCTFICCILLIILVYSIFTNRNVATTVGAVSAFSSLTSNNGYYGYQPSYSVPIQTYGGNTPLSL